MTARTTSLLGLTLLMCGAALAGGDPPKAVRWADDLHAARAEALRTRKPILIVFGADWCGYCKKMERDTLADPATAAAINERFVPVHLDVTEREMTPAKKVAQILEVKTLPTCVILSPEADLLGRVKGYQSPRKMGESLAAAEGVQARIRVTGAVAPPK